MPRIRMNTGMAGVDFTYNPGAVYDVEDAFAEALCADGRASLVDESTALGKAPRIERASKAPAEPVETRTAPEGE